MLNWTQLVPQGRAKDIGIPWNDEEQEALATLIEGTGMERSEAAQYVRNGILTVEDYEKAVKGGNKPAGREELEAKATELGIQFDAAATDTTLRSAIAEAEKKDNPAAKTTKKK